MSELLPCPFCGAQPTIPDGYGTEYTLECSDCGIPVVKIQISDHMIRYERIFEPFVGSRFKQEYIDRAAKIAAEIWNRRI
jgi:endogenous inhibitor of DNA gyrase (YacG/DUF329 family)